MDEYRVLCQKMETKFDSSAVTGAVETLEHAGFEKVSEANVTRKDGSEWFYVTLGKFSEQADEESLKSANIAATHIDVLSPLPVKQKDSVTFDVHTVTSPHVNVFDKACKTKLNEGWKMVGQPYTFGDHYLAASFIKEKK